MFEWLEQEISAIKTPQFHSVEGPADVKLREAVIGSILALPSAYKEFTLKFGTAKLYRRSRIGYRIGIFAGPRQATIDNGASIYHIGWHDGATVYVKPVVNSAEFPVFEFEEGSETKVADSFEEWVVESSASARNAYGRKKWEEILRGPKPFTAQETEIIEARRMMHWLVLGVDTDGNHIFEIINASQYTLAALTVGVRSKDGRLNGAVRLNVHHVGPGQRAVLHTNCYKDLVSPQEAELFALPDPKPEDRDYYWEFRKLIPKILEE
ncbi:MAG: hypothetical protein WCO56_00545 [Verrucomicrobiota bacterium]